MYFLDVKLPLGKIIRAFLFFASCLSQYATALEAGDDIALFGNGGKSAWDSTGHVKANGVRMKISYPNTWAAAEGSRPHIVQKFVSGAKMDMVMIQVIPLNASFDELNDAEKQEALSREILTEFLPDLGKAVSHSITKIDGEMCAMMEFELMSERVGLKLGQKSLAFIIPRPQALLIIHCATGGEASSGLEATRTRYDAKKPLFLLIANSCILTDKWDKK